MKKLTLFVFVLSILVSCSHESGKKEKANEAEATVATTTLADNFTKIGEFTILVKTSDSFSSTRFYANNANIVMVNGIVLDQFSKTEKTKVGFKKVFVYRLQKWLTKEQINEFVQSQGGKDMTMTDMAVLEEQHKKNLPTYVWMMGGDLTQKNITVLFSFDPSPSCAEPVTFFLLADNRVGYLWKDAMAITFYHDIK